MLRQTSARKPSSGEVSAARQTGADKTSTAAPQNGQNEPHYPPKGPARLAVLNLSDNVPFCPQ